MKAPFVLVTGGKGGVGKTTLAANLGVHLARNGLRVLLCDLDLALANLHVLLGVSPRHTLEDFFAGRDLGECVMRAPGGVDLLPAASGTATLSRPDRARCETLAGGLSDLARGYDVVIGDSAAGIGPEVLFFAHRADQALVVTTPEPAALTDAYGLVKAIDAGARSETGWAEAAPTPEIFLNMVRGSDQADRLAARLRGVCEHFLARSPRLAGWMPRSNAVLQSSFTQRPFVLGARGALRALDSLENRCVAALSRRLEGSLSAPRVGIVGSSSISP